MKPTFRDQLLSALLDVSEEKVLVVRANDINERSALNRLAYHRGYATKPIHYDGFCENYIYQVDDHLFCYSKLPWRHECGDDHDYLQSYDLGLSDDDAVVIYYHDAGERHFEAVDDENVCNLDYNAVVFYPNKLHVEFRDQSSFLKRKAEVTRHHTRRIKGDLIDTLEQELLLINNIFDASLCLCSFDDILRMK